MQDSALEWVKAIGSLLISWPAVGVVFLLVFRKPLLLVLDRFVRSVEGGKAIIGPITLELGKLAEEGKQVVTRLNRITELGAESKLLELEITDAKFGPVLTSEQRERMRQQIKELRELVSAAKVE
jgi:hypothetical protein